MRSLYLALSIVVFLATASIHWLAFHLALPEFAILGPLVAASLLCVPLIGVFVEVKAGRALTNIVWEEFWMRAYAGVPKWMFPLSGLAGAYMIALVIAGWWIEVERQIFRTSAAIIPAAVSLTFARSCWRGKAAEPSATDNPDDAQRLREDQ